MVGCYSFSLGFFLFLFFVLGFFLGGGVKIIKTLLFNLKKAHSNRKIQYFWVFLFVYCGHDLTDIETQAQITVFEQKQIVFNMKWSWTPFLQKKIIWRPNIFLFFRKNLPFTSTASKWFIKLLSLIVTMFCDWIWPITSWYSYMYKLLTNTYLYNL